MRLFEIENIDSNPISLLNTKEVLKPQVEEIFKLITRECKPWFREIGDPSNKVYRGFAREPKSQIFRKSVRQNRRPRDSKPEDHDEFNRVIGMCGKVANRSNAVFVTGEYPDAASYGKAYVVIPIGNFNYTWHTVAEDWTANKYQILRPTDLDDIDLCNEIKGDDNTLKTAILSNHEIMISCKEILGISPPFYNYIIQPALLHGGVTDDMIKTFADITYL